MQKLPYFLYAIIRKVEKYGEKERKRENEREKKIKNISKRKLVMVE